MEEIELGEHTLHLQEQVNEVVEELKEVGKLREEIHQQQQEEHQERNWLNRVAVSTGIFSALAAIAAMQGNYLANEGMLGQIQANDQWTSFQAKSTKRHVDQSSVNILQALGKPIPANINEEINRYEKEQKEIQIQAKNLEAKATIDIERHELFASSVAALQVAISLGAVATLVRRREVWYLGLGIASIGLALIIWGTYPGFHGSEKISHGAALKNN